MTDYICADIGGTKTIISLIDKRFRLHKTQHIDTPKSFEEFKDLFESIGELSRYSDTLNISLAGRVDKRGRILMLPNINLKKGLNIKRFFGSKFKRINIENDAVCAALKAINDKKIKNGLVITWGTGIGGAIVINGKVFLGNGAAGEIGHVYFDNGEIENRIGGKVMVKRFGMDGKKMQELAKKGDKKARNMFSVIGEEFGSFLRSLIYIFDPSDIVLVGSFTRSWNFMKPSVYYTLNKGWMKPHVRIHVVKDKFYTLKGSYLLGKYGNSDYKL
ncbi:MAG: ROK family protein [Nanoarchaeota archaeon]|nr:ROK family protein [Nanoarchaeota archaeon]